MSKLSKQKVEEFSKSSALTSEQVFNSLALYIYSLSVEKNDLYLLAQLLSEEDLIKLISYFDGDYIRIPKKYDFYDDKLKAMCFYLHEYKKYSWSKIREFLNITDDIRFNSVRMGIDFEKIRNQINKDLEKLLIKQTEEE